MLGLHILVDDTVCLLTSNEPNCLLAVEPGDRICVEVITVAPRFSKPPIFRLWTPRRLR